MDKIEIDFDDDIELEEEPVTDIADSMVIENDEDIERETSTQSDFDLELDDLTDISFDFTPEQSTLKKSSLTTDELVDLELSDFDDDIAHKQAPFDRKEMEERRKNEKQQEPYQAIHAPQDKSEMMEMRKRYPTPEALHAGIFREDMAKNYVKVDDLASYMILSDGNHYDRMNRIGNELAENGELLNRRIRNILEELDERRTPTDDIEHMVHKVGQYIEESLEQFDKLNRCYNEMKADFEEYVHHSFGYHGAATRCMDENLIRPEELEDMQFYAQQRLKHSHAFTEKENKLINTYSDIQELNQMYSRFNSELHEHSRFQQLDESVLYRFEQRNREFLETSKNVTDNFIQQCEVRKDIIATHFHELEQLYGKIDIALKHSGLDHIELAIPDLENGYEEQDFSGPTIS